MKLAKASQAEIDKLMSWLQARENAKFENSKDRPPAFMRVVFGYETLVQNCCDPEKNYLDWKPGMSPDEVAALRQERDALAECKKEALEVESRWDCQSVAKLLGIALGHDIRPNIEPQIRALIGERYQVEQKLNDALAENARLKAELKR